MAGVRRLLVCAVARCVARGGASVRVSASASGLPGAVVRGAAAPLRVWGPPASAPASSSPVSILGEARVLTRQTKEEATRW